MVLNFQACQRQLDTQPYVVIYLSDCCAYNVSVARMRNFKCRIPFVEPELIATLIGTKKAITDK